VKTGTHTGTRSPSTEEPSGFFHVYIIPEGREVLELREWRPSWPLGLDFPTVSPPFNFFLILFLFALGVEVPLLG